MIPFEFEYYRPSTIYEALELYNELKKNEKAPLYYSGGTEIICMARLNQVHTGAVIDIKEIPECSILENDGENIIIGSANTLAKVSTLNIIPLLSNVASRIADNTVQNKITVGGNIAGKIKYKEALLPFLLYNSEMAVANKNGIRTVPIEEFMNLKPDDLIVNIVSKAKYANLPFIHVKKTKLEKIDYPLVTIAAINDDDFIKLSISGLCNVPFRSKEMEDELNNKELGIESRVENAIRYIPYPVLSDIHGSSEYREHILKNTLRRALSELEAENV